MHAIIFANGDPPDRVTIDRWINRADMIIVADGGTRNALAVGVQPHVIIGDLDSLTVGDRAWLERSGAKFIVYPSDKDYTDLELALRYALGQGAAEITLFCALGGRWDQSLANLMLLTLPELDHVRARIIDRGLSISVIRDRAELNGQAGDTLSLIALKGDAHGVTIEGCQYPLTDAVLPFGATLGISNVFTQSTATITVKDGIVLAVHSSNTQ